MFTQQKQKPTKHLVLDIDGTLATTYSDYKPLTTITSVYPNTALKDEPHTFVNSPYPHVLHRGAVEFIQFAAATFDSVSFFSTGNHARNQPFVTSLLTLAFGEQDETETNNFNVFSNTHLTKFKKDLTKLKVSDTLDNVILVDDKHDTGPDEQLRNLLLTHGAHEDDFCALHTNKAKRKFYSYDTYIHTVLRLNHLFFVTGLLKRALAKQTTSLADALYELQYHATQDQSTTPNLANMDLSLRNDAAIYQEGLAELKRFNPALEFYGGEAAQELLAVKAAASVRLA